MKIKKEYKKPLARTVMLDGQVMLNNGSIITDGNGGALFELDGTPESDDVVID